MKVLILHPNDEQRVIRLQEEIGTVLKSSSDFKGKVFKHFPLWCDVSEVADGLEDCNECDTDSVNKKIAGEITGVRIFKPEFSGAENEAKIEEIENVSANVEIVLENKKVIKSKLILSTFSDKVENKIDAVLPDFEMDVKIFRIGDATFEGNRYFITDGEWRKLKK